MSKSAKKRAEQYEPPLKIKGTLEDVLGVAVGKKEKDLKNKEKPKESAKKDKEKY